MKIAVVSDSHGGKLHLRRFVEYCGAEGVEKVYHLGDVVEDARWLSKQLAVPLLGVAGNCDYMSSDARMATDTVEGKRILLVHGDRYGVRYGNTTLSYFAEEQMADVALYGHTHRAFTGYVGRVLLINPGALKDGSFCLMEVTSRDIVPRILDIDEWYDAHNA